MTTVPYVYQPPFIDEDDYPEIDKRTCRLLGPTALIVQSLMGVFVILSLVYKRHREKRKRPWKIWTFDVSKQIVGQMFVHGINVLISYLVAHHASGNPCVLYFLNVLIDTTLGVAIIYIVHRALTHLLSDRLHLNGFQSGQYGDPPSFVYWVRQAAVYVTSLTTMKLLVVGLFAVWPGIKKIGQWLLSWTGGSDAAQVIIVMGMFPIVMNILQFWLIDSIVKASAYQLSPLPETAPNDSADHEPLMDGSESDDEDLGDNLSHHDIENPPPKDVIVPEASVSRNISSDEGKLTPSSGGSSTEWEDEDTHLYPPSLSSSPQNAASSPKLVSGSLTCRSQSPDMRLKRIGRKRSPPPPLHFSPYAKAIDRTGAEIIAVGATPRSGRKPALDSISPSSQTDANGWDMTTSHSER